MIGNNDWFDYMEYRDHIAHSMGAWDKSKVKYKDKIPVGGGKFRYIYDEPKNPRSNRGRMEPRTVQQQRAMGRSGGMQRVQTNSRQASRSVNFKDHASGVRTQASPSFSFKDRATGNTNYTQASPSFNFRDNADATRARREAERRGMEQQTMQGRAQNEQQIAQNKRPKNLFDHMGNALNAAGRMAGDAARGVGNWVGDRAREVGEAASGAWNNVTGGDGRLDLDDVRRGADSVLRGAGRAIGLEARSNLDVAKNKEARTREMRDIRRVENEAANDPDVGKSEESKAGYRDRYTQAAQEHGAASRDLREAQNAYDNTLAGRVENAANAAGNWLGDTARNVGNWIGDRAADARDAVSGMVDQAGRSLGSVYDQMSGREDGSTWNRVTGGDGHFNYEDVGNAINAAGREAQNIGRNIGNAAREAGQWMGDRAADFRDNVSGAVDALGARAGSAYDRMRGREDGETWNNITGGDNHFNYGDVQNVANAVGRRAQNLYDQAGNAIGGVGDFIGERARDVGDWVGDRASDLRDNLIVPGELVGNAPGVEAINAVGRASGAAGNWLGDTARNVGEWIGNRANDAGYQLAERASEFGGALRDGRDFINNATGVTARNNLEAARNQEAQTRDTRDLARIAYRNTPNDGYQARYTDAAQAHGAATRDLREAQNAYNNTPLGRAENFARGVGEAAGSALGNVSSAARNLIQTAGGNINQALTWAQQRLRYAQNTGNPQMERDAQAIMRELENLPQQRL